MPPSNRSKVCILVLLHANEELFTYVTQKRKHNREVIDITQTDGEQQDLPSQPKIPKLSLRPKKKTFNQPVLERPNPDTSKALSQINSQRALSDAFDSNTNRVDGSTSMMPPKQQPKQLGSSRRVTRAKVRRPDPLEPVATSLLDRSQLMPGIEQSHVFRPSSPTKQTAFIYPAIRPKD
ncbi:MAG: hypothetical protein Q9222_007790, partial [Ikaeria aurantiellina]